MNYTSRRKNRVAEVKVENQLGARRDEFRQLWWLERIELTGCSRPDTTID
jgi:hypothetical protein